LERVYKKVMAVIRKKGGAWEKAPPSSFHSRLELEPQPELHGARSMRPVEMQEARTVEAPARIGCVHRTADGIKLCMVEQVEGLPAEIQLPAFAETELLEQPEVEVETSGKIERVPSDVAKRQSCGHRERRRVVENRAARIGKLRLRKARMGVAHQIGARPCAYAVSDARIVAEVGSIRYAERCARLRNGDTRNLPSSKKGVGESGPFEKGQRVDVANGKGMSLVKVGRSPVARDVVCIHEGIVKSIRGIVDRVAIAVRKAER